MKNKIVLIGFSFLCATQSVYAAEPTGVICGVAFGVAAVCTSSIAAALRWLNYGIICGTSVKVFPQPGAPKELDQQRAPSLSATSSGTPPVVLTMATTVNHSIVVASDDDDKKSVIEHSSSSSGKGVGGTIIHANE